MRIAITIGIIAALAPVAALAWAPPVGYTGCRRIGTTYDDNGNQTSNTWSCDGPKIVYCTANQQCEELSPSNS